VRRSWSRAPSGGARWGNRTHTAAKSPTAAGAPFPHTPRAVPTTSIAPTAPTAPTIPTDLHALHQHVAQGLLLLRSALQAVLPADVPQDGVHLHQVHLSVVVPAWQYRRYGRWRSPWRARGQAGGPRLHSGAPRPTTPAPPAEGDTAPPKSIAHLHGPWSMARGPCVAAPRPLAAAAAHLGHCTRGGRGQGRGGGDVGR
jgi:hypothetical protein